VAGWRAVCGTLPDPDVFLSYGGPVADFTYRRGFSHSPLVLTPAAPLIGRLISRIDKRTRDAPRR
jgi:inner membrane protein